MVSSLVAPLTLCLYCFPDFLTRDLEGWTLGDYLSYLDTPAEERDPPVLYGKDLDTPKEWIEHMEKHLPDALIYRGQRDLVKGTRHFDLHF